MNRKQDRLQDRNFDDTAHRFKHNIYGGMKGRIRLEVLQRDLAPHLTDKPLSILDAGGGQGQFSLPLAEQGHHLTLCDISEKMLQHAQDTIDERAIANVTLHHCALQTLQEALVKETQTPFDLVICHAVLEWLAEPQAALKHLRDLMRPGGILSLSFYNVQSIVLKNALRTNYQKILEDDYHGYRGSLTPIHPLASEDVQAWREEAGLTLLTHSGIRVFYDYRLDPQTRDDDTENLLQAELKYSQIEPFRSLGRYIHFVLQRPQ